MANQHMSWWRFTCGFMEKQKPIKQHIWLHLRHSFTLHRLPFFLYLYYCICHISHFCSRNVFRFSLKQQFSLNGASMFLWALFNIKSNHIIDNDAVCSTISVFSAWLKDIESEILRNACFLRKWHRYIEWTSFMST